MKRFAVLLLTGLALLGSAALAETAPAKMTVPPEKMATQADGELETYDLTFPEDMPLEARNFVLFARAQFEKHPFEKLPKANEYTQWYYHDKREIGWCSVFQIYCAYHSGLQLLKYKQDVTAAPDAVISAMEGRVGNVYYVFEEQGRWLDGTQDAYIAQFQNEYALCEAAGPEDTVELPAWTVQTVTGKSTAFEDETVWTNESMAQYFGVRSVKVVK